MATKTGPQDMPPPGGFAQIKWARNKLKNVLTAPRIAAIFFISQLYGWNRYRVQNTKVRILDIEMRSSRNVIMTFVEAERDRELLKNLRRNREFERELMKDYPDWEVGTYFGVPIFETIDLNEEWYTPKLSEYLVHSSGSSYENMRNLRNWN